MEASEGGRRSSQLPFGALHCQRKAQLIILYCQHGRLAEGTRIVCPSIQEEWKWKRKKKSMWRITFIQLHEGEM
eukprot:scaffold10698_cov213-Skeletonema_marinoi.AAC.18